MLVSSVRSVRATALLPLVVLFGCPSSSDPCGDLEYEPETESCVCPAGFEPRPELGICEGPDGSVVRFDGGPPMLDAGTDVGELPDAGFDAGRDAGQPDTGTDAGFSCGAVGEPCCVAPSSACIDGANCTPEGCEACGGPGEPCCDDGPACQTLTCIPATDRCPRIGPLVQVTRPGGGTYGVDAYEVTRDEYEDWLATSPTNMGALVGMGCSGNTSFVPPAECLDRGYTCAGAGCGETPQACVDWCDAYAYCASVGKQLCGGYSRGQSVATNMFDNPAVSAWFNACSAGGVTTFGNGDDGTVAEADCRFTDSVPAPVYELTECQSDVAGYGGVFALTGNVREWLNSCGTTIPTRCMALGGSFADNDEYEGWCSVPLQLEKLVQFPAVGFRCCELGD